MDPWTPVVRSQVSQRCRNQKSTLFPNKKSSRGPNFETFCHFIKPIFTPLESKFTGIWSKRPLKRPYIVVIYIQQFQGTTVLMAFDLPKGLYHMFLRFPLLRASCASTLSDVAMANESADPTPLPTIFGERKISPGKMAVEDSATRCHISLSSLTRGPQLQTSNMFFLITIFGVIKKINACSSEGVFREKSANIFFAPSIRLVVA